MYCSEPYDTLCIVKFVNHTVQNADSASDKIGGRVLNDIYLRATPRAGTSVW